MGEASLKAVPRALELAASQLQPGVVALKPNRDLVDREFAPSGHILHAGLQVRVEKWSHLVQLIPCWSPSLWRLARMADVKEGLPRRPFVAFQQVGATMGLERKRLANDLAYILR